MLLDLLDAARSDRAQKPALDDLSFDALHDGAARVATQLSARGVARGDRIAIYSENRHGFAFAYLAALRLGAIAVPVNVLYRASDLAHVVRDADPAVIVHSPDVAAHVAGVASAPPAIDVTELETWAADARIAARERVRPDPEETALVVYTSGTTGVAKGAMLSHRNLASIAAQLIAAWRWQAADTLLIALPLFHVHGLIAALTTSLCAGGRALLRERFEASDVLATLAGGDVTMFFGVPTMYVRLLERAGAGGALPPSPLRLFVSGSAALPAETHRAFEERFGAAILERYGATEFGFALGNRYAGPRVPGSVGVPLPGVRVRIVAPGALEALPAGDVGELLVAGPNVFGGYWKRPEATADAFAVDTDGTRWYRSGDLASYDAGDDVYRIVGRIKELIITAGFNVYPREVEEAIESLPRVRACAVIGKPDAARGELPIAFIETEAPIRVEDLFEALRERIASFKVPKEIYVVDALPRNAMGKLDKPALRARLETIVSG
ncbi:MAG: AMP-binding protein [Candidatus Eremiobacteraeota bacterium]|nr:AMP-binding protein [Candidatus Eremiobacteraeota bacterium]